VELFNTCLKCASPYLPTSLHLYDTQIDSRICFCIYKIDTLAFLSHTPNRHLNSFHTYLMFFCSYIPHVFPSRKRTHPARELHIHMNNIYIYILPTLLKVGEDGGGGVPLLQSPPLTLIPKPQTPFGGSIGKKSVDSMRVRRFRVFGGT